MVGRLVEAQHVAAREQDAGQLDAAPLAAGQHADRQLHPRRVEAEPGGERPRLALGGVAAADLEVLLGLAVAGDVAFGRTLLHRQPQLLDPDQLVVDATPGQHVGDGGAALEGVVDARVLGQVAEAALAHHLARRRLDATRRGP